MLSRSAQINYGYITILALLAKIFPWNCVAMGDDKRPQQQPIPQTIANLLNLNTTTR